MTILLELPVSCQIAIQTLETNPEYPMQDVSSIIDTILDTLIKKRDTEQAYNDAIDNLMQWLEYDGLCIKSDIEKHTLDSLLENIRLIASSLHKQLNIYQLRNHELQTYRNHTFIGSTTIAIHT